MLPTTQGTIDRGPAHRVQPRTVVVLFATLPGAAAAGQPISDAPPVR
jgi:hypothetical protein